MEWLYILSGVAAGAVIIAAFVWFNNSCLKLTRITLTVKGLEKSVKIAHLSDLHGKSFGRNNARLVALVESCNPDFIAITGDIIHDYSARGRESALRLISSLSTRPVLFVAGNHEMRNKGYRFFRAALKEAGATVLDDTFTDVCGVRVAGLNCASLKNNTAFGLKERAGADPVILLAHMPQFIDKYAAAGYSVALCGHAHGGQWRIPFTGKGLYAPGQGVFPKLTAGVHSRGGLRQVISRGLGNSKFPLRLFNRPEVIILTLTPEE